MRSKELSTMNRPKLSITGCIAHGFSLCFAVSNANHPKDSSAMAELFGHMLTRLSRLGVRLSDTIVHLVSDNTSRETKNNTLLRLLTVLVHHRRLALLESPGVRVNQFRYLILHLIFGWFFQELTLWEEQFYSWTNHSFLSWKLFRSS